MSRSSDAYTDHINCNAGGTCIHPEKCLAERIAKAKAFLEEHGMKVVPAENNE